MRTDRKPNSLYLNKALLQNDLLYQLHFANFQCAFFRISFNCVGTSSYPRVAQVQFPMVYKWAALSVVLVRHLADLPNSPRIHTMDGGRSLYEHQPGQNLTPAVQTWRRASHNGCITGWAFSDGCFCGTIASYVTPKFAPRSVINRRKIKTKFVNKTKRLGFKMVGKLLVAVVKWPPAI